MNAKKWILFYLLSILLTLILLLSFIKIIEYKKIPLRFTNSISYDAKLNFLRKHRKLLKNSDTLVVGSSMALNNIDSSILEKNRLFHKIINISSWGLQTAEVLQLLKLVDLSHKKYVIYSTQYIDFKKMTEKNLDFEGTKKYLENKFSIYPYIHTLNTLFINIKNNLYYKKIYLNKNSYKYLKFDKNGDVNYHFDSSKYISHKRWAIPYKRKVNKNTFKNLLKIYEYLKKRDIKLIVVTTPMRKKILNLKNVKKEYEKYSHELEKLSKNRFVYINAQKGLNLNDDFFVDKAHVNYKGAIEISKFINKNIKNVLK